MKTHKDLEVWKRSIDLVLSIYKLTCTFPKDEIYGLISQLRRASVSVPGNISEGAARKNSKEFERFLYISLGSLSELETQLIISFKLQYLDESNYNLLLKELTEIRRMIQGLIRNVSNN